MENRLVERFLKYVRTPSESGHELPFCLLAEEELKKLGFAVTRDECGSRIGSDGFNIYAFRQGNNAGEPLLFCCHLDTVAPGTGIAPVIRDGMIFSDQTTVLGADDKCGVAAVLEGIERLSERGRLNRSVEILFTVSEETGLRGSAAADYSRIRSTQAVVFDSGEDIGTVINRCPAMINLAVTVTGKAAHAAVGPSEGIHALKAAAKAVDRIAVGFVDEISEINVGNLLAPGKTNVICPKATFEIEVRSFEKRRMLEHRENICRIIRESCAEFGAGCEITGTPHAEAVYVSPDSPLLSEVSRVFKTLGIGLKLKSTFGGSDSANLAAHGIGALNLSCGMNKVHSTEEYLIIEDMEKAVSIVEKLLL